MFVGVSGELDADVVFSAWIISCRAALSIAAARSRITGSDTRRSLMACSTGPGLPADARLCVNGISAGCGPPGMPSPRRGWLPDLRD